MQVECPHCQKTFVAPDSQAGQIVACQFCGGQMQLPALSAPPAAPPPEPIPLELQPRARSGGGMMLGPGPGAAAPAPGATKPCPYCGEPILAAAQKCRHCRSYLSGPMAGRDGRSAGASSSDATGALVLGILGLVLSCIPVLPLIMGALAVHLGGRVRKTDDKNSLATAGYVLGIIDCVLGGLFLIVQMIGCMGNLD